MRPLAGVLAGLVDRLGLRGHIDECRAVEAWPAAVGPRVAGRSTAVAVRGGTLLVAVASAAWAQQLTFLKPTLVKAINQRVGRHVLDDIHFSPAHWRRARAQARLTDGTAGDPAGAVAAAQLVAAAAPPAPGAAMAAAAEAAATRESLAAVADPALRGRFLALAQAARGAASRRAPPRAEPSATRARERPGEREGEDPCSSTSARTP